MHTLEKTKPSGASYGFEIGLFVVLCAVSGWGLAERGIGEGTELRVLERATGGLAEGTTAWGALPLEGAFPSTVVALAFRHAWLGLGAVRVASFAFAGLGVSAIYAVVRVLGDAKAARAAALVLATLPLFVVHAGTLLPDTITFASGAVAFSAFTLVVHARMTHATRLACLVVGVVFAGLGVATRGILVGLCIPLAPFVSITLGGRILPTWARVGLALAIVVAFGFGIHDLGSLPNRSVTFDAPLASAMHELFPWSCAFPLAWSSLARRARTNEGTRGVAPSLLVGLALSYGVALLAARAGAKMPFVAPYLVAVAVGMASRDADRRGELGEPRVSPTAVLASLVFTVLLARDAWLFPETSLVPFSLAKLPQAVIPRLGILVPVVAASFAVGLAVFLSPRPFGAPCVARHSGTWFLLWGTAGALVFLLMHHRVVSAATSPRGAVDAYRSRNARGGRLGLLGVSEKVARITGEASVTVLSSPEEAARWLGNDPDRFVAAKEENRAALSALYRARYGRNVPELGVVGASDTRLFVGLLPPNEASQNPLERVVLDHVPEGYFPAPARFSIPVAAVGARVEDARGNAVTTVSSGFEGTVKVVYRALGAVPAGYCSFVHVDVRPTRAASEERDFATYPTRYWREGDFVVVAHAVKIPHGAAKGTAELGFGLGVLPCTDDRRAEVIEGRHTGNRVYGGTLDVR